MGRDESRLNGRKLFPPLDEPLGDKLGDDRRILAPVLTVEHAKRKLGGVRREVDTDSGKQIPLFVNEGNRKGIALPIVPALRRYVALDSEQVDGCIHRDHYGERDVGGKDLFHLFSPEALLQPKAERQVFQAL